ncbi:DUF7619 domain-containing protein [Flavobacterium restrictum]|uniref:T9SS type A sorting domain-containing protein n=1 Tax=Flavobacterium restrictum TaxID=2594428 RepID=A0A553DR21_9FLAO|nr:T9SS type A sorting domain-containing protein [Flavobacterium restrictum]TRX35219.1 T9SS type A sorting domain-containing protein [Flavobacterium restrictum]
MKKRYFLLFIFFIIASLQAQPISFSDANFKSKLVQSDVTNTIARNLSDDYFAIDVNKNGEIELNEAAQVSYLELNNSEITSLLGIENFINLVTIECSNNAISNLDISHLKILTDLVCDNNNLVTLTLNGATNLQNLYCQSNQLTTLNANDLLNLLTLNCSDNKLTTLSVNNLNNLQSLLCNSNAISTLNLDDLISLLTLDCSSNSLTALDFSKITNIVSLNCNFNLLSTLTVTSLLNLNNLACSTNKLTTLTVAGLENITTLNCNNNQLTTLNTSNLDALTYLYCANNNLQSLLVTELKNLKVLDCNTNKIQTVDLNGLTNLQSLYCNNNILNTLNTNNQTQLQTLLVANNNLNTLFLKNGSSEGFLDFSGNPNLNYICADELETAYIEEEILNNNYTNCEVNSYCIFVPGGNYYSIEGSNKYDSNSTGCDVLDINFQNLKVLLDDGITKTNFIANTTGFYSFGLTAGTYTLQPQLENPNYYTITPASSTVTFPDAGTSFNSSFCIAPNGNHSDLEINILPLDNARASFDSSYKIVYKNKGTVIQSGVVSLNFDGNALNVTTTNPLISSQSATNLMWNFTNLKPQETQTITVTFKVKSTIPADYQLNYSTNITNVLDITPADNSFQLTQVVATILNKNAKICLEGHSITPENLGDYLHYMIRFENSGSTIAKNIVVEDIIDTSKFDITTLIPLYSSNSFTTKITNTNNVAFLFENINLPFAENTNKGYVAFKIKTKTSVSNIEKINNSAQVYFDYEAPITTNTATTSIQTLQVEENNFSDFFTVYPNPVKDNLNLISKNQSEINSIEIYNTLGQLLQTFISPKTTAIIPVSGLKKGLYILKISAVNGNWSTQFLKE